ncbi:putative outer membrane protein PmpB precursor [Rubripirellula lacrimiformis]|uniref:Putative outer membrane protein PmpB n=1 Tax=Rubripirellula lacrimiformis TaxID=1930273 RepID=A0A517NDQ0_9BACT|nr:dockerin type I domain-containing protein [Rubripirellula lacrimiformis]QDT05260.1 putative outer membrane protein PmpB precursor [Rubripirellula lacrimiformis]
MFSRSSDRRRHRGSQHRSYRGTYRRATMQHLNQRCLLAGDIEIVAAGSADESSYRRDEIQVGSDTRVTYTPLVDRASIGTDKIVADLVAGRHVTVKVNNDDLDQLGKLRLLDPIIVSGGLPASLELLATDQLLVQQSIRATAGSLQLRLDVTATGSQPVSATSQIIVDAGVTIATGDGTVDVGRSVSDLVSLDSASRPSVLVQGNVQTRDGSIRIHGQLDEATASIDSVRGAAVSVSGSLVTVGGTIEVSGLAFASDAAPSPPLATSQPMDAVQITGIVQSHRGRIIIDGINSRSEPGDRGVALVGANLSVVQANTSLGSSIVVQGVSAPADITGGVQEPASEPVSVPWPSIGLLVSANTTINGYASEVELLGRGLADSAAATGPSIDAVIEGRIASDTILVSIQSKLNVSASAEFASDSIQFRAAGTASRAGVVSIHYAADFDSSPLITTHAPGDPPSSQQVQLQINGPEATQATILELGPFAGEVTIVGTPPSPAKNFLFQNASLVSVQSTSVDLLVQAFHAGEQQYRIGQQNTDITFGTSVGTTYRTPAPSNSLSIQTGSGSDTVQIDALTLTLPGGLTVTDLDTVADDTVRFVGGYENLSSTGSLRIDANVISIAANVINRDGEVSLGVPGKVGRVEFETANPIGPIHLVGGPIQMAFPVTIANDVSISTEIAGIRFADAVDEFAASSSSGAASPMAGHSLVLSAAQQIQFAAGVGQSAPLGEIEIVSARSLSLAGSVNTSGDQSFVAPVHTNALQTVFASQSGNIHFADTLDAQSSGSIDIDAGGRLQLRGSVGANHKPSAISFASGGPIAIDQRIFATSAIDWEVRDSASDQDQLQLLSGALLVVDDGSARLIGGDQVDVDFGARVIAKSISILVDQSVPPADPEGGQVRVVGNLIPTGGSVVVTGGPSDDRLDIQTSETTIATRFFFDGGPGDAPGDVDRVIVSKSGGRDFQESAVIITGPDSGRMTADGYSVVTAVNTEQFQIASSIVAKVDFTGGTDAPSVEISGTLTNHEDAGHVQWVPTVGVDGSVTSAGVVFGNPRDRLILMLPSGDDHVAIHALDDDFHASIITDGGQGKDRLSVDQLDLINTPGRALDVTSFEQVSVVDSQFVGNSALVGAGIRVLGGSTTIAGTLFVDNIATGHDSTHGGGAVFVDGPLVVGGNSRFTNNQANGLGGRGGAIASTGRELSIDSTVFDGNTAALDGGAVYQVGKLTLQNSTLESNVAGNQGGAVFHSGDAMEVRDSQFLSNHATGEFGLTGAGGALFTIGQTPTSSILIADSTFDDNEARSNGGAIVVAGAGGTFSNVVVSNNRSDHGGGLHLSGVMNSDQLLHIVGTDLTKNQASSGGGIEIVNALVHLSESTISRNHSTSRTSGGGGMLVRSTLANADGSPVAVLEISDTEIVANTAAGEGGGLSISAANVQLSNSSLRDNVAESRSGGGIQSVAAHAPGTLTMQSTEVTGNRAGGSGGGISVVGTGIDWQDILVDNNFAADFGGGVDYRNDDESVVRTMVRSSIQNNVASRGYANLAQTGLPIDLDDASETDNFFTDVNRDAEVNARDALLVINRLAADAARIDSTADSDASPIQLRQTNGSGAPVFQADVNGDGRVTALDALLILNQISRVATDGEPMAEQQSSSSPTFAAIDDNRQRHRQESTQSVDEVMASLLF